MRDVVVLLIHLVTTAVERSSSAHPNFTMLTAASAPPGNCCTCRPISKLAKINCGESQLSDQLRDRGLRILVHTGQEHHTLPCPSPKPHT
jgi:hypothetical protein